MSWIWSQQLTAAVTIAAPPPAPSLGHFLPPLLSSQDGKSHRVTLRVGLGVKFSVEEFTRIIGGHHSVRSIKISQQWLSIQVGGDGGAGGMGRQVCHQTYRAASERVMRRASS